VLVEVFSLIGALKKHQRCADEYTEICNVIARGQQVEAINPSTGEDGSATAENIFAAQCAK
jgi:hypothetical protein